ncbi:MAG TPA: hypothetical protein VMT34_16735 [Aggregatilineales bacterium]|nr:hypothetical protein [Aggregatilineales bacterium]
MRIKILLLMLLIVLPFAVPTAAFRQLAIASAPQPLDLPQGDAYLSPDGMHIFLASASTSGPYSLCVYSAAVEKESCGTLPTSPDLFSIRWSPDSKWIAFTENFFLYFREPDIWVMDAQSGKVTDLTDDQIIKLDISKIWSLPSIDVEPVWTPDSSQIVFIRYHGVPSASDPTKHDEQADLYRIAPTGGDPVQVGTFQYPTGAPPFPTYVLTLSPDGKQIAYNVDALKPESAINGLWVADLDGKNARQVLNVYGLTDVAFSADGHFVLELNALAMSQFKPPWDQSSSLVVALDGDNPLTVDSDHPAQWAAWSPSGASLAYIVAHSKQPEQDGLYVVDAPGKAGKEVVAGEFLPPAMPKANAIYRTLLHWASNDTVLVRDQDKKLMLVSLK